ncbi:hypothetical protein lerEdw1_011522 [Lerista edwardsae]|nr:hypothetical protein lerEdw1_011522 [Lerista edwardsae]
MKMLVLLLASWLVLAQSAAAAPHDEQPPPPPSDDLSQTEITDEIPLGFPEQEAFPEQIEIDLPLLIHGEPQFTPRARKPHCSGSSPCTRRRPLFKLDEFPPARPSLNNLGRICAAGRKKVSYGPWNLPQSGFSHLVRQGDALNRVEAGLDECCQLPLSEKLPCGTSVWLDVLEQFCDAEFSAKTKPYSCCKLEGPARQGCFEDAAPYPKYNFPGAERGRSGEAPQRLPELPFPPGRPASANLGNICALRQSRPAYPTSVFPRSGFGWYLRQAQALNRLESGFKKCCQTQDLGCARRAWEKSLTQFCKEDLSVKTRHHPCCKLDEDEDRFACFAVQAPYPDYDQVVRLVSLAEITPSLLEQLCGPVTLLTKQRYIPALVKNITGPCCNLLGDERTLCATEAKSDFIATLCGPRRRSWTDPKDCCSRADAEALDDCFNLNYLASIPLAGEGRPLRPTRPAV